MLVAAALTVSACAGAPGGGGGTDGPISWMSVLHTPTTPDANGPVELALEELTGEEFDVQWIPAASTAEKLNSALASGALADLVTMGPVDNATVRTALGSGMFWDVEDYLDQFPNLAQIDPEILESARIDGELWGVPVSQPKARYGVVVRQDWLDNLGLEVPRTIDELTEVARAFTEDDPDGNGVDDTVGFYDRAESYKVGFRSLTGYFGAPNFFGVDEQGEVVPSFMTDEFRDAMEWYRGVYENGWVNQEFVTVQKQNQIDGIAQGRGGIVVTGLFEAKNYLNLAESANPDTPMEWALINDMTSDGVDRRILSDTNGGMGGWLSIPKEDVPTEEGLLRVLGFVDSLMSEEAFDLMTNGIEGQHFEIDTDGVLTITDQTAWEQQVQPYNSSRPSRVVTTYLTSNPLENEANELMTENDDYVVINPAAALTSSAYDRQWSTLEQQVMDAFNQYITGHLDMAGFEAVVDGLGGQGLDQVVTELTEAQAAVG